jgi:tetratricopeptide (TPR) repeat protein
MKWLRFFEIILWAALLIPWETIAQEEEESAAISMEDNIDVFQELFFEALKQKGIENYDRAIKALIKCKELAPDSDVVDYELAKSYLLDKQLVLAQEYAVNAIISKPENKWYLNTMVEIMERQSSGIEAIKDQIPFNTVALKENLASIYFEREKYDLALEILKQLGENSFSRDLNARILDSLESRNSPEEPLPQIKEKVNDDPFSSLINELNEHFNKGEFQLLEEKATEAMETYPAQPFFYCAKGAGLIGQKAYKEAITYLIMGLDLVFDDDELNNRFYRELVKAYRGLGDTTKANMYLSRIKNGS